MSKNTEIECLQSVFDAGISVWTEQTKEAERIITLFESLHPNPKKTEFPDFIGDNGFVEHFQITATKETSSGSAQCKLQGKMNRELEKFRDAVTEQGEEKVVYSKYVSLHIPKSSYLFVKDSFQKNWMKHIDSFQNHKSCHELSFRMFMIDARNIVSIAMSEEVPVTIQIKDRIEPIHIHGYQLLADKEMMRWVYRNSNNINYVVFVTMDRCDVIPVERLPILSNSLPYNFKIYETFGILTNGGVGFKLPNLCNETEDKQNDSN